MPPHPKKRLDSPFRSMKAHHVAMRVPDFAASKRWFVEKLDFRVLHEWPYGDLQLAYLAPPTDDEFHVEIMGGGVPLPRAPYDDLGDSLRPEGYHHVCLTVDSVREALEELRRRQVKVVAEPFDIEAISRRLAFIADPWGNLIELSEVLVPSAPGARP